MRKKISLYLFLLTLFAFSANALSDVKINNTISYINSETQLVNISFINNESQAIWCQLNVTSPSTANSTGYHIYNVSNITVNNIGGYNYANATINFIGFEDSNDYTLQPYCQNYTDRVTGTSITSVTIDFDVPDTPTSLAPTSASNTSIVFSAAVNGSETTGCTLYFTKLIPSGGASSYSLTHSGNLCYSSAITTPEQTYDFYIQVTDNTNTTNSATAVLTVDIKRGKIPAGANIVITEDGKYVYNENGDILCGGYAKLNCPEGYQCVLYDQSITDSGGECVIPKKTKTLSIVSKTISGMTEKKIGGMTIIIWLIVLAAIIVGIIFFAKRRYQ